MGKLETNLLGQLEVMQDGCDFYNETSGELIWSAPHGVTSDYDLAGAIECRKQFEKAHSQFDICFNGGI